MFIKAAIFFLRQLQICPVNNFKAGGVFQRLGGNSKSRGVLPSFSSNSMTGGVFQSSRFVKLMVFSKAVVFYKAVLRAKWDNLAIKIVKALRGEHLFFVCD